MVKSDIVRRRKEYVWREWNRMVAEAKAQGNPISLKDRSKNYKKLHAKSKKVIR